MKVKVAFLDRDGVINENVGKHQYVTTWDRFVFKAGAVAGIQLLNGYGYKIIIVTNQRGIARGLMTEDDLAIIHQNMQAYLQSQDAVVDGIFYCPHENGACNCRKPDIGLFLKAEKMFMIDKAHSFIIGDSLTDIQAGSRYGIAGYFLEESERLDTLVKKCIN